MSAWIFNGEVKDGDGAWIDLRQVVAVQLVPPFGGGSVAVLSSGDAVPFPDESPKQLLEMVMLAQGFTGEDVSFASDTVDDWPKPPVVEPPVVQP